MIDKKFALKTGIRFVQTQECAEAANRLPLDIVGQSELPVSLGVHVEDGKTELHLGIVLVINNLGVDVLIGEPGKEHNNIICLPKKKYIIIAGGKTLKMVRYMNTKEFELAQSKVSTVLQPRELSTTSPKALTVVRESR